MNEDRDPNDGDLLAAEYALGTLGSVERDVATRLRLEDPKFARAVAAWEQRLSPFADGIPSEMPSEQSWKVITARTVAEHLPVETNVIALRRSVSRWRSATLLTGALAAALAVFALSREVLLQPAPAGAYLAALNRGGDMPALIVRVDLANKAVTVRPIDAETPPGKSLELWYVAAGQAPKSMGVLKKDRERMLIPSGMEMDGAVFAVSLEPAGGSPTGTATGPIVYKGALIQE